jgi:hypothetical protein
MELYKDPNLDAEDLTKAQLKTTTKRLWAFWRLSQEGKITGRFADTFEDEREKLIQEQIQFFPELRWPEILKRPEFAGFKDAKRGPKPKPKPKRGKRKVVIRMKQSPAKALPERLYLSIGGHFGPSYEVRLEDGRLTYTYWPPRVSYTQEPEGQREEIEPSALQWQAFRTQLDRLDVWCWQAHYLDSAVCDGTGWSVEIVYPDKAITSGGSNCFPGRDAKALSITAHKTDDTFAKFCAAVASLLSRKFH